MGRVVHFELPADNVERASEFYRTVFGWNFIRWEGPADYLLAMTGTESPGIDGAIVPREQFKSIVNTIDVDSVDETIATVTQQGGTVQMPKMAVPGVGWLAYFADTEGNLVGIMQNDPQAA
jgi:predicted enzyme related to lactoylglutathione lyase